MPDVARRYQLSGRAGVAGELRGAYAPRLQRYRLGDLCELAWGAPLDMLTSCDGTELDRLDRPARYPPTLHRMSAALGPPPIASVRAR